MYMQQWTKIEQRGTWPKARGAHAACCLGYGQLHQQLLVSGGVDNEQVTLNDVWLLDVSSGKWKEVRKVKKNQVSTVCLLVD